MLLVDVIQANPQTKSILFHGGYPWVVETGAIAMKHRNVWIDSCWLTTLSYTVARRAYQEWLDAVPSDRIMWGANTVDAEGIYAATEFTRQCLAEALTGKVERGELLEKNAIQIGRQVMRENALKAFPKLKRMLWQAEDKPWAICFMVDIHIYECRHWREDTIEQIEACYGKCEIWNCPPRSIGNRSRRKWIA